MLKLLPILFFAAVNITQISIFEIDGIFSNSHINAIQRYIGENDLRETSLFVIQYNASDTSENSVVEYKNYLMASKHQKPSGLGQTRQQLMHDF